MPCLHASTGWRSFSLVLLLIDLLNKCLSRKFSWSSDNSFPHQGHFAVLALSVCSFGMGAECAGRGCVMLTYMCVFHLEEKNGVESCQISFIVRASLQPRSLKAAFSHDLREDIKGN